MKHHLSWKESSSSAECSFSRNNLKASTLKKHNKNGHNKSGKQKDRVCKTSLTLRTCDHSGIAVHFIATAKLWQAYTHYIQGFCYTNDAVLAQVVFKQLSHSWASCCTMKCSLGRFPFSATCHCTLEISASVASLQGACINYSLLSDFLVMLPSSESQA